MVIKTIRFINILESLSTVMEVTVSGMDAAVEPIEIYSRRVTGMIVLNSDIHTYILTSLFSRFLKRTMNTALVNPLMC